MKSLIATLDTTPSKWSVWNRPIFVEDFDTFRIFVQGIIALYGKNSGPFKDFPKGKQTISQGIFTPFGVQCKVFLQGFAQRARKKRTQGIFTPSGIQWTVFLPLQSTAKGTFGGYLGYLEGIYTLQNSKKLSVEGIIPHWWYTPTMGM